MTLEDVSVLLVDDNTDHRATLASYLESFGARVYAFGSSEALTSWRQVMPEVVVADLVLDTGMTLIRELRLQGCRAPAIAVAGYSNERTRAFAAACGFNAHLEKPVAPALLLTTITGVLPPRSPQAG